MHKMMSLCLATACVAVAALPALAQEPGSRRTREFVQAAGQSDTFEILEADTVLAQSSDSRVRAYAQRMIDEHRQSSHALADATARSKLQPPPMSVSSDQAQLLGALQNMRGPEFDRSYMRQQALAHRSTLVVDQMYAANGDDAAVRRLATSATQMTTAHIALADQIRAKLGDS